MLPLKREVIGAKGRPKPPKRDKRGWVRSKIVEASKEDLELLLEIQYSLLGLRCRLEDYQAQWPLSSGGPMISDALGTVDFLIRKISHGTE